jgi:hypothetical protein
MALLPNKILRKLLVLYLNFKEKLLADWVDYVSYCITRMLSVMSKVATHEGLSPSVWNLIANW